MSRVESSFPRLPARHPQGHKGTFGTVVVVGGCCAGGRIMSGAPGLAAIGAFRAGAGLVRLVTPDPVMAAAITLCPSATGVVFPIDVDGEIDPRSSAAIFDGAAGSADAIVIGPGFGTGEMPKALTLRALQQEDVPVVVDADGLTNLAATPDLFRDFRARAVLTPHPGEFARLASTFKVSPSSTDAASRSAAAEQLAQRLGCVVVLKGAGTVVSNGLETWTCDRGHACMATAGTGDVLAGVIGGVLAQFHRGSSPALSLLDAAKIGVMAHAIAGERWAATRGAQAGMLAEELAGEIPFAMSTLA